MTPIKLTNIETEERSKEIERLTAKAEELRGLLIECDGERLDLLDKEILSLEEESVKTSEEIAVGRFAKDVEGKLIEAKERLEIERAERNRIAADKERFERIKAIKEHFAAVEAVEKAEKEVEEREKEILSAEEEIAQKEASIIAGKKVCEKKEEEFVAQNAKTNALNEAFDELIKKNGESSKRNEYFEKRVNESCARDDAELAKYKEERNVAEQERESVLEETAKAANALKEIRRKAEYRKAIREGGAYEVAISEKRAAVAEAEKAIRHDEERITVLKEGYAYNEAEIAFCAEKAEKVFVSDDSGRKTVSALADEYNDLERKKQGLYRDQIMSATFLQDVGAIDKKISENTAMRRSCEENRRVLENAKATLVLYMKKCETALAKKTAERNGIEGEKKFYQGLDKLSYGDKCPLCSAPVSEKADAEKALVRLESKETELQKEIDRLKGVEKEYLDKLDKVNLRLGAEANAILSSGSFINSLEQTKLAHLSALEKIYRENGVRDHEELTNALEKVIGEMAKKAGGISDVKAIAEIESRARRNLVEIEKNLKKAEEAASDKRAFVVKTNEEILNLEKAYAEIKKGFEGESAVESFEEATVFEGKEDELYAKLAVLGEKERELNHKIEELVKKIAEYESRDREIEKDGAIIDYTALCFRVVNDQYAEIVSEIRREEKVRNDIQNEILAISGVLKDKQAEVDELKKKNEERKRNREELVAYAKTLRGAESYNSEILEGTDYETVKSEIVEESEAERIKEELRAREEATIKCECEVAALTEALEGIAEAREKFEDNLVKAKEISQALKSKAEERGNLINKIDFNEVLTERISALEREKAIAIKRLNEIETIANENAGDLENN